LTNTVLIVGAGFYGAVCAHELSRAGIQCHVIEKRDHIGGNCFTRYNSEADCHEHVYGPHIFHTNAKRIWDYINQFAEFNNFVYRVKVNYRGKLYSFPVNLFTLHQIYGVNTPDEARRTLESVRRPIADPGNIEDYCLSAVGEEIYRIFIEGYTRKQWNKHPSQLPADIVKRIPIRLNFDDNYFNDRYQGIPIGGYTAIFEKLLAGVALDLGVDFLADRDYWMSRYDYLIYTGPIDAFFDYALGVLEYRSLRFETRLVDCQDYQGNAAINYTDVEVPWTRIVEHKHFDLNLKAPKSLVTTEYPVDWSPGMTEFYPVGNEMNIRLLKQYQDRARSLAGKVHFGGRLGEYRYLDMHRVIGAALAALDKSIRI
jgi:UDP-galactopyranose mutase